MTGKERILRTLRFEEPDRVPVFPIAHYFTAGVAGMSIRTFSRDGEKMASALLAGLERFGWDGLNPGCDVCVEAEAMGSVLEYPENFPPHVVRPAVLEPGDFDRLRVPDPLRDGRMPVVVQATRIVAREAGSEICVMPCIMGPLNCASQLRGVSDLLTDTVERPELVDRLLDLSTETAIVYGKALVDAGASSILVGEALCTPGMISPKYYRTLVPRQRRVAAELKQHGADRVLLHICGNVKRILPDMAETGMDLFDLDWQVDLGEAKKICAPAGITMRGNLDPSGTLLAGTPEKVYAKSSQAIAAAAAGGGFILGSGCDVAPGTPFENLDAMMAAAVNARA